ncbi:rhodanese-like domain-containing protein [Spirillospora sp. CA-255316]
MSIRPVWRRVEEIKTRIENLGVAELRAEREADPELLVVDLREIGERVDSGAIPGSVHVPRGMLEFWADPATEYYRDFFAPGRRTVLYCAGGGRSALAVQALLDMGYENVAHLEAGFAGWRDAGAEVADVASTSRWVRRA